MAITKKFGQKNCHLVFGTFTKVFYSYTTPVVVVKDGGDTAHIYVTDLRHSVTTTRHIKMYLGTLAWLNKTVEYVSQDAIATMAQGIA